MSCRNLFLFAIFRKYIQIFGGGYFYRLNTICVCGLRELDSCNLLKFSLYSQSSSTFYILVSLMYRKIPKVSPFRRGLSTEGNLRFKIDWASLIVGGKYTVFTLSYLVFEGNFQVQAPEGLILGGAI